MTDAASRQLKATGLSPAQVAFFGAFGFVHLPGFLGDDIGGVTEAFEQVFAEQEAVETFPDVHFGGRNLALPYLIDHHPDLAGLRTDPRILGVVESLIGDDYEYRESAGNIYWCDTAWHCDIYDSPLDQFHIKFLFYLDPLDGDTGALRVIPGTQEWDGAFARSLRRDLDPWSSIEERFGVAPQDIPSWSVPCRPGDVIVSNFRTIHATFGGGPRRRLMTMNYRARSRPS